MANEANRQLADALYELADYVLHADATQKGLSYQKAAKSVREAPQPIKSKEDARKLIGIGKWVYVSLFPHKPCPISRAHRISIHYRSVGDKIQEYLDKGTIQVLEEYRSGERGQ